MYRSAALVCIVTALAAPAPSFPAGEEVLIVDASGGGDYVDIQPAVDAAGQRDTLLVKAGTYGGFTISNKSLNLVADSVQPPRVQGYATIADLPGGRDVSSSDVNSGTP